MPFTKPGNIALYVPKKSNHPPHIIENIRKSINRRLSEISFDVDSFNEASPLYQKALDDSGYNLRLTFSPPTAQTSNSTRRNHQRNIIWYNPLLSRTLQLTWGGHFLRSLMRNSRGTTRCIRFLTGTLLRSVTVACPT